MARRRKWLRASGRRSGRASVYTERLARVLAVVLVLAGFVAVVHYATGLSYGASLWAFVFVVLCGGAGYGLYQLYRVYARSRARERGYLAHDATRLYRYVDPKEFEHHVADIFERQGFTTSVTRYVGDHGIDIEMVKDGKRFAVQTKRYALSNPVTEPEVRNFYGSIANLGYERGYVVTSGRFTLEARRWVGARSLTLIDGAELADMQERAGGESSALSQLGRMLWKRG